MRASAPANAEKRSVHEVHTEMEIGKRAVVHGVAATIRNCQKQSLEMGVAIRILGPRNSFPRNVSP